MTDVRAALRVSVVSLSWALTVGAAALLSGLSSDSIALVGLGLNSLIDGAVSAVLVWRFRVEHRNPGLAQRVEVAATRLVGCALLLVAAYVAVGASVSLATGTEPHDSTAGVVLSAGSVLVLPILATIKVRLGTRMGSRALRADGVLSGAGAVLAAVTLGGLLLDRAFGWGWADPIAALAIAAFITGEGWAQVRLPGPPRPIRRMTAVLGKLRRVPRRAADRMEQPLTRALERMSGRAPVIIPEYSFDPRPRWGWNEPPLSAIGERLAAGRARYQATVDGLDELIEWAGSLPREMWDNDFWGGLDALLQVSYLKQRDPALYLEVGSGWSTSFARRAIIDFGLRTKVVSIDPVPRADIDSICDEVVRAPAESVAYDVFDRLEPGDVFLIDGSHLAVMNADATYLLLDVLPRLRPGVLVGVHDIFLPWDYPPTWEGRFYGEQYVLGAFVLGGHEGWRVDLPTWWVCHDAGFEAALAPAWAAVESHFGRVGSSFWMERT